MEARWHQWEEEDKMAIYKRQTMIFFLPLSMGAFSNGSTTGEGEATGSLPWKEGAPVPGAQWARKQLYINPTSFSIKENKLVKPDLTKGGYVVQYFGEQLQTIDVSGTTGSSGVEGINILRDIYRHEQHQFRHVLAKRQEALAVAAQKAAEDAALALSERTGVGGTLTNIADLLTGGGFTDTVNGVSNAIDIITEPFGGTSIGDTIGEEGSFQTVPTLAAFATNIDLYYQGEFYRGFFNNFSTTESSNEPGHFTYSFSFTITRRTGKRENFMPWHREPSSRDGETRMSQRTTIDKGKEGAYALSFPLTDDSFSGRFTDGLPLDSDNKIGKPGFVDSKFNDSGKATKDSNSVSLNRNGSLKGGG